MHIAHSSQETTPCEKPSAAPQTTPAVNSGFIKSFAAELSRTYRDNGTTLAEQQTKAKQNGQEDPVQEVMNVFTQQQLPAIHTLAQEFCVCDHWHSEVPGPTEPNRLFMHAATSTGLTYNPWMHDVLDVPTIFNRLEEAGRKWAMYGFDLYDSSNFESISSAPTAKLTWQQFLKDAAAGSLPYYSFICPRYSDSHNEFANSQHAPYDVRYGDVLIADTYEAVRNGPGWEKTLLVVTYDEHGGYYDHVAPPRAPAPDAEASPNAFMKSLANSRSRDSYLVAPKYEYNFESLGIRVPALLISPWIEKGVVNSTVYQHTSVLRYIEEELSLPPLTKRDAAAASFVRVLSRSTPRADCPQTVPTPELPESDPELVLKEVPHRKKIEVTRRYTAKLKGHRDSGRPTEREFQTGHQLCDYIEERNRSDQWYHNDDWKKARYEIYRDRDHRWRWRLRDGNNDLIAASTDSYDCCDSVLEALQRARFLSHILSDPQIES